MLNVINDGFLDIEKTYEELQAVAREIYLLLTKRQIKELRRMNKIEKEITIQLQNRFQVLSKNIQDYLNTENKVEKENRMQKLALLKDRLLKKEEEVKKQVLLNQALTEALIQCGNTIVNAWIYASNKEKITSSIFMHKRL